MEAAVSSSRTLLPFPTNIKTSTKNRVNISVFSKSNGHYSSYVIRNGRLKHRRLKLAMSDVSIAAADDIGKVEVTWQIIVGAIAGITPFVVAGIQFSKRIIAQRRCEVCGGSGLVLRDKDYFRCPGCGGFLPWQSWKRFFSG